MKKLIIISTVCIALILSACSNSSNKSEQANSKEETTFHAIDTTQLTKGATYYQCEMHHEVTSDQPGSCPKCGMDLEKVVKQ